MGRDVLTIVQRLGWTHKVVHREVWIAPCPYCHDGDANPEKQVRGARGFSRQEERPPGEARILGGGVTDVLINNYGEEKNNTTNYCRAGKVI